MKSACEGGHHEIVRLLVSSHADVNLRHRSSWTPLHIAASHGHDLCVVELLAAGAARNALDVDGNTPLLLAAQNCRETLRVMKRLVDAGVDLERRDAQHRTALHHTSYRAVGTELLLSAGADPDVQDDDGNAPIHLAAIEGFDTIIRCLATYNCDPDLVNKYGKMAVHYLAMKGHWSAIEDIARINGELNRPDAAGNVPLWYAVDHKRTLAVKTLLRANCDPDPPPPSVDGSDLEFGVPLHAALKNKLYGIAKQLLLAGCGLHPLVALIEEMAQRERELAAIRRSTLFDPIGENERVDENEREALEWFREWLAHPRSLRHICRTEIRRIMRPSSSVMLNEEQLANLPVSMQDFITMRELDEHQSDGITI